MKYKGTTLILDNFRSVLSGFSVDVQDVVRSAILDDIDVSGYIDACKDAPFKLEQIRLAVKQKAGLESFFSLDGDTLYRLRQIQADGVSMVSLREKLKNSLSKEHLSYLLDWTSEGIDVENLDIAVIPKDLLSVFDSGLRSGVDMSVFCPNATSYSYTYLSNLVGICKSGMGKLPVHKFIDGTWSQDVVSYMNKIAAIMVSEMYVELYKLLEKDTPYAVVSCAGTVLKANSNYYLFKKGSKELLSAIMSKREDEYCPEGIIRIVERCVSNRVDSEDILSVLNAGGEGSWDVEKSTNFVREMNLRKSAKISGTMLRSRR